MAGWKELQQSAKKVAAKAISTTSDLSDTASLHVKLARKEAMLADIYEQFGRVAYQKIKTGSGSLFEGSTIHWIRTKALSRGGRCRGRY